MEMKKLLRGYGIREVNLLNKEIMVSASRTASFLLLVLRQHEKLHIQKVIRARLIMWEREVGGRHRSQVSISTM